MLLAVGLLAVHATVLDEAAGIAVLELERAAPAATAVDAAVGAHVNGVVVDCNTTPHLAIQDQSIAPFFYFE